MIEKLNDLMQDLARRSSVAISAKHDDDEQMSIEELLDLMFPEITSDSLRLCSHYDGKVLYEFDIKDLDGTDDEIRKKINKQKLLDELRCLNYELRDIELAEKILDRKTDIESRIESIREKLND